MAGALALKIGGITPTKLLGIEESPFEDLMLNAAIISKVAPSSEGLSLREEIERKRQRWLAKRYYEG